MFQPEFYICLFDVNLIYDLNVNLLQTRDDWWKSTEWIILSKMTAFAWDLVLAKSNRFSPFSLGF